MILIMWITCYLIMLIINCDCELSTCEYVDTILNCFKPLKQLGPKRHALDFDETGIGFPNWISKNHIDPNLR